METNGWKNKIERLSIKLGLTNCEIMKAIVFAGGLALIWNDKIVMRCLWKDDRIICYEVERDEGMEKLRFTAYGPPYYKEKVNF